MRLALLDYRKGQARDLEIQKRGNPNQTGGVVKRRFISAFPAKDGRPREFTTGSGQLELAQAITEDAAPLSARVIVNRVWRHHFGRGLVATPSEFGAMGEAPTHPELLDDLTARFVANGWSLKWLHREILISAAWQQDSLAPKAERADPKNRLFARMPRRRLDVEAWRDAMLAVSGLLDRKTGGASELLNSEKNHRRTLYGTVIGVLSRWSTVRFFNAAMPARSPSLSRRPPRLSSRIVVTCRSNAKASAGKLSPALRKFARRQLTPGATGGVLIPYFPSPAIACNSADKGAGPAVITFADGS